MVRRRRLSFAHALLTGALLIAPAVAEGQAAPNVDDLVERMLTAIGGRSAWAGVTNTVNDSWQYRLDEPTVVRAVISMDFARPRFRVETTAPELHLIRVVDGLQSWRLNRQGIIEDVPAPIQADDRLWYAGHVYRTLHRVAARDSALHVTLGRQGRLEVYEGRARIAWFALDARGEPYAFGAHGDEIGSICGPWNFVQDGIHHPAWVARPDGSWRAMIIALTINASLEDSLFLRPASPTR